MRPAWLGCSARPRTPLRDVPHQRGEFAPLPRPLPSRPLRSTYVPGISWPQATRCSCEEGRERTRCLPQSQSVVFSVSVPVVLRRAKKRTGIMY